MKYRKVITVYRIILYSTVEITQLNCITESGLTARMYDSVNEEWTEYDEESSVEIYHPGGGSTEYYEIDVKADYEAEERLHYFNIETEESFLGRAYASVTGSTYPTPELSTVVLMSAGLLGSDRTCETAEESDSIKVSIIVCTYSKELFPDTIECIRSLSSQDYQNKEILLVMDENEELHRMYHESLPASVGLIINPTPGLSAARNCGIQHATGDVIVFIDDDATAGPDYLASMVRNYEDETVIGVVGKILPGRTPGYPAELYWVGGFTYKGFAEETEFSIRVMGAFSGNYDIYGKFKRGS